MQVRAQQCSSRNWHCKIRKRSSRVPQRWGTARTCSHPVEIKTSAYRARKFQSQVPCFREWTVALYIPRRNHSPPTAQRQQCQCKYSVILSVLHPRKCEYLKDYSLHFEHAYMTTYLASWEACRYLFAALWHPGVIGTTTGVWRHVTHCVVR